MLTSGSLLARSCFGSCHVNRIRRPKTWRFNRDESCNLKVRQWNQRIRHQEKEPDAVRQMPDYWATIYILYHIYSAHNDVLGAYMKWTVTWIVGRSAGPYWCLNFHSGRTQYKKSISLPCNKIHHQITAKPAYFSNWLGDENVREVQKWTTSQ